MTDTSSRRADALAAFQQTFGSQPTHIARAPGRVNIIGEHTDYNDGFVLPAAIDRAIHLAGRVRADDQVIIHSLDYHDQVSFRLDALKDEAIPAWTRYIRGVLWIMAAEGHQLPGIELSIAGDVPLGAGFSSSAAIEIGMFEIVMALIGVEATQARKAQLSQQVEHRFIGLKSGIMDQMISACGAADHALLIDCRSLETKLVPLPSGVSLLALDTGVRRELSTSKYGERVAECTEAARIMGVNKLRDASLELLDKHRWHMPEVVARRAEHVITENQRTLDAVAALHMGDLGRVGQLMNGSHTSLSSLYEVSIRELDIMAELTQREAGCYGARMMGGGFGGAVIALVDDAAVEGLVANVLPAYQTATGREPAVYVAKAGPGSGVEAL